jgi:hypothetical protein
MPMSHPPQQGGASVHARGQIPSTDLSSLIHFLVKVFPPSGEDTAHPLGWSVLKFDPKKHRLSINTYGILRRLLALKEFREAFRQTPDSGFLRDLLTALKIS